MIPKFHLIRNFVLIIIFLFSSTLPYIEAMRIHPMGNKRNVCIRDGAYLINSSEMEGNSPKKLRKLPHVFSKVLELPFRSDADVEVEEGPDFFRFIAQIKVHGVGAASRDVRAHAVEIHPGVIKIVIRKDDNNPDCGQDMELSLDKLEVDTWRYRLPSSSRADLASAVFVDGELIVTVPKDHGQHHFMDGREIWGGGSPLFLYSRLETC